MLLATASLSLVGIVVADDAAHATGYVVTTTTDGGPGSLRDAIDQANANPGADTITVPAGTYTLTIAGADEDLNATGDFDILTDITITGAGAATTIIDAAGIDRVFEVLDGTTVVQGLTLTNGDVTGGFLGGSGGNILLGPDAALTVRDSIISHGTARLGGGIGSNQNGVMQIVRSEIVNNVALPFDTSDSMGGGVVSSGPFTMSDSLIAGNDTVLGEAALFTEDDVTVTNSTFTGNSSAFATVTTWARPNATKSAHFVHVTIAGNSTTDGNPGDAFEIYTAQQATLVVTVEGSLLQSNLVQGSSSNCASLTPSATFVSEGNNLTDDTSCTAFVQPSDQTNNSLTTLGALADNGGPTRTMALQPGSSAIDGAGNCGAATPTDQRGLARPTGAACDVGAYEVGVVVAPTTSTTTTTTTTVPATDAPTTVAAPTTVTPTSLGNGAVVPTTLPVPPTVAHGVLPSTGTDRAGGFWLAALLCSIGGLLVLAARRRVLR
jgi:hypothetical protein